MFKALSTQLIQHLIAQNSWANAQLQPYVGQSIALQIALFKTHLVILENGSLAVAGQTKAPDASMHIAPSVLLRLMAQDEAAKLQIKLEGDTQLASAFGKVLAHLRWDIEDDLSKVVGDIPAQKITELGSKTAQSVKESTTNLAQMLSEYWQEEKPMLAKKRHVEAFNQEVDTLRADVERFEKRLNKLSNAHSTSPTLTTDNV